MDINFPFLVLLATFVFFTGQALEHFGFGRDWVRVAVGLAAALLALSALLTLIK